MNGEKKWEAEPYTRMREAEVEALRLEVRRLQAIIEQSFQEMQEILSGSLAKEEG